MALPHMVNRKPLLKNGTQDASALYTLPRFKPFRVAVEDPETRFLRTIERTFPTAELVHASTSSSRTEPSPASTVQPQADRSTQSSARARMEGVAGDVTETPRGSIPLGNAPAPSSVWPDGKPADPQDPKAKWAVQRTKAVAVVFTRKADAVKYCSELKKKLVAVDGYEAAGNVTSGWCFSHPTEDPLAVVIRAKPRRAG